jgi:hypothetical protein
MLSRAKPRPDGVSGHLLFPVENKQKQILRADLQQSLQVEIGTSLAFRMTWLGVFHSFLV